MPPSAVVDATILVSAFLFSGSVPGQVLKLAARGAFTMHLSALLLEETQMALLTSWQPLSLSTSKLLSLGTRIC